MPGLKKHDPAVQFSGNKVTPDEMDKRVYYHVLKPSIGDAFVGTVEAAAAGDFVLDQILVDYPRTLLLTILGEAAGMGGTATITGTDQFGVAQSETLGFGSANGGGTVAGTKIFDSVSAVALDGVDGDSGTAIGTASIGLAKGTAAGIIANFGLPVKIGATSDVKRIIWNNGATITGVGGGTISSTYVTTASHSFNVGQVVDAGDDYYVEILSTYDSSNDANVA